MKEATKVSIVRDVLHPGRIAESSLRTIPGSSRMLSKVTENVLFDVGSRWWNATDPRQTYSCGTQHTSSPAHGKQFQKTWSPTCLYSVFQRDGSPATICNLSHSRQRGMVHMLLPYLLRSRGRRATLKHISICLGSAVSRALWSSSFFYLVTRSLSHVCLWITPHFFWSITKGPTLIRLRITRAHKLSN